MKTNRGRRWYQSIVFAPEAGWKGRIKIKCTQEQLIVSDLFTWKNNNNQHKADRKWKECDQKEGEEEKRTFEVIK